MSDKPQIEFPCDYPIKIIARATQDMDARIIAIINKHQDRPFEGHLLQKGSSAKNYLSFTLTLRATSEEQLKALFEDLKKDEDVMMVL